MKRILCLALVIATSASAGWSQQNEKDTLVETVNAQSGSLSFTAQVLPDFIQLQWQKGPDDAIAYFELYRSADGMAYNIVKQILPQTFDNNEGRFFSFRDEDPLRGKNYYRLVAVMHSSLDKRTVELQAEYKNQPRKLQPTLVSRGAQLYIQNYDGEQLNLIVYNTAGNPLFQRVINSSVVDISSQNMAAGMYIYQLVDRRKWVVNSGKFAFN